jgi:hypothetical protein
MDGSLFIVVNSSWNQARMRKLLERLPPLAGGPIRIESSLGLRDSRGPVHAGSFLRDRLIKVDCRRSEFPRVFVHELFHFAWQRLGNPRRISYERLLASERRARARGELGWSAEWRRRALLPDDLRLRSRRWREYCCESFCDSAAWLYSGVKRHNEFTLPTSFRERRRAWFRQAIETCRLSI